MGRCKVVTYFNNADAKNGLLDVFSFLRVPSPRRKQRKITREPDFSLSLAEYRIVKGSQGVEMSFR